MPSPGNGPAVSSGMTGAQASPVAPDAVGEEAGASADAVADEVPGAHAATANIAGEAHELEHAAAVDQRGDVGLQALVIEVERLVVALDDQRRPADGAGGRGVRADGGHGWAPGVA